MLSFCLTAQPLSKNGNDIEGTEIEKITVKSESIADSVQLRLFFEQEMEKPQHAKKTVILQKIYQVRLAQLYARNLERINTRSTELFAEATGDYPKNGDKGIEAWLQTQAGFYFYSFSRYNLAVPYFVRARRIMDNFPSDKRNLSMIGETYMKNAFFAGTIKDDEYVLPYLQTALDYTSRTSANYGTILAATGMHYFRQGFLEEAMEYHQRTLLYASKINDSVRYAKALGEIAQIHLERKEYNKAMELLKQDIEISKRHHDERNTMFAQIILGKLYLLENNVDMAKKTLDETHEFAKSKTHLAGFEYEITKVLAGIAQLKNNSESELNLRRQLSDLQSILAETDGESVVKQVNLQMQKENFDKQLQLEKSKREQETLKKTTFSAIAGLLAAGIFLLYLGFKRKLKIRETKYQKMVLSLQLDKINSEKKLMETHNSLVAFQTYLLEKNEQISQLENEMKLISASSSFNLEKSNRSLEKLLESHLMTEESWLVFKDAFIREDYRTYKSLLEQFPNISESALRIELLQTLGLSNVETARILGLTVDAVKKSKQRLRRKLEMG